jgi:CheY-like chemotaxis protein
LRIDAGKALSAEILVSDGKAASVFSFPLQVPLATPQKLDRLHAWPRTCIHSLIGKAVMEREGMSVLVVEDEKLLNWSLASSLSKWGFEVQPVFTGNEALAQIEKSEFDIFLLDYRLPDVDGLAIARTVRIKQPDAVIFLLTSFQLNELPVDAGLIDIYINKPLDLQQLHQALREVSRLRGCQRAPSL